MTQSQRHDLPADPPMPPTLEALAPRRTAAARNERVRGAPRLFACSLVLGAAIAFVVHGASAAAAEPSQAMRTRGAATPSAPAGHEPTASADEAGSGNDEPPAALPTGVVRVGPLK